LFCLFTAVKSNNPTPFRINLGDRVPHLDELVSKTHLPAKGLYPAAGIEFGIQLDFLRDLQTQWLHEYSWADQEAELNK
jgi:hypothetical protein